MSVRTLTLNSGSSSLKFALYDLGAEETLVLSGGLAGIGRAPAFKVEDGSGRTRADRELGVSDHGAALQAVFDWLEGDGGVGAPDAIGHRLVHGGEEFSDPLPVTEDVLVRLLDLVPLAPDHLPRELELVKAARRRYPDAVHVACFDTAFHRHMPPRARTYALPRNLRERGVLRYGFHGLSYESILSQLRDAAAGRVIVAHLGSGASLAAIREGRSVETTMGFTPAGGLVMSTRSGDLDPGVIVYLMREEGLDADAVNELVNRRSGLLGVSGLSADMRELLAREVEDDRARAAIELFCYQARKFLGALATALEGLDTVVFTAGIGERAPSIRRRICEGLEFLGIELDPERNRANAPVISRSESRVVVRVMKTNEELMIARHTRAVVERESEQSGGIHR